MYVCTRCQAEYATSERMCWSCMHLDCIFPAPVRRPAAIDSELQVTTARELVKRTWNQLDLSAIDAELRVQPRALMVVSGPPGAGKSTLGLLVADAVGGAVVVYSAEERLGASVGERLGRLGIRRRDVHLVAGGSVDAVLEFCRKVRANVFVIDSVQVTTLLPRDLRAAINTHGFDLCVCVSQVTKAGDLRGSNELRHEADVVLEVEAGSWTVTKSRFAQTGLEGSVFDVAESE